MDSVSGSRESWKKEMEEIKAELSEERSKRKKAEANNVIKLIYKTFLLPFYLYEIVV